MERCGEGFGGEHERDPTALVMKKAPKQAKGLVVELGYSRLIRG